MSELNQEVNDSTGAEDTAAPAEGQTTEQAWAPSQEEFTALQEQMRSVTGIVPTVQQMAQFLQQAQAEHEGEEYEDLDVEQIIQARINQAMAPIMPIVQQSAQKSGQEQMNKLFKEQEDKLGKFDHELAERAAHSYFQETGNPVKAVEMGAKYAADYAKKLKDEAVEEYKKSLRRPGPADPGVDGSGDRAVLKAKNYDEVIERWAGTTEV